MHKNRVISASCLAIAAAFIAEGVFTVASAQQSAGIDTITVTATKREESAQDIPIAVSAFSGDELRERNIVDSSDLTNITPGLSFTAAGSTPAVGLISIRGVSQNDFAGHLEAANAFYIDEVYRPSISANIQALYDVERVEVLKGPQGTLFGRNTTGGLIHIITKQPTQEFEGYLGAAYGSFDQVKVEGALSGALSDTVSARGAFYFNRNDGWIKNDIGPDVNADDTRAGRIHLLFEPTDKFSVLLTGEYYKIDNVTAGAAYPTGAFTNVDGLGENSGGGILVGLIPDPNGYIDADGDPFTGSFNNPGNMDRTVWSGTGKITYDFGGATLTSITNYSSVKANYIEDNDLSPYPVTDFVMDADSDTVTQELRLAGEFDKLAWTLGGYFINIDGVYDQRFQFLIAGADVGANYSVKTTSYSGFVEGEYALTPTIGVTGGVRWTYDEKEYAYLRTCLDMTGFPAGSCDAVFALPPFLIGGAGLVTDKYDDSGISARAAINWRPTDNAMLYASWNRGWKAFSYNAGFLGAAAVADVRFDSEKIDAYEVGAKLDFWESRARLNASFFYYDYTDYQAFDQRGTSFTLYNTDASIYGADAEFILKPVDNITFLAGASWIETEVKDVPIATGLVDRESPQAPQFTVNFAVTADAPVSFGLFRGQFDVRYTDEYYSQLNNAPLTLVPSNWLANARISYFTPDEHFELAFFARNVFDEERQIYAFDISTPLSLDENNYAPPRWIGVEARVSF
ncbi:MAG: TonB-dependent receptor [Parvularculaceae bacterium]